MTIVLLAAYASGIILANLVQPWEIAGLCVIACVLFLTWCLLRKSSWASLPFLAMLCLAGLLHTHQQLIPPATANHVSQHTGDSYKVIEAVVMTIERRATGGSRILADVLQIGEEGRLSRPAKGKVLLYTKDGELNARPGQVICWRSRLNKPFKFGNPGEFDYPLYLAAQGIHVTAYTTNSDNIVTIQNHPDQREEPIANLRLDLAGRISKVVPGQEKDLVQSLLLGFRGGLSEGQRQILAESGIAHLFAISGLHFGLLALLLYQVAKWLYLRSQRLTHWCPPQRTIPVLLIAPLAVYLLLTGNAWATRRAFLMVSLVAVLVAGNRRVAPFSLLAAVAFCLLLVNPLALLQPGFQLSFAGVAGILAWLPLWQERISGVPRLARGPLILLATTLAATMATAPVILWHFHTFSPAGILTNLAAIPLIAWGAVPTGLAGLAAHPFSSMIADHCLLLSGMLVAMTIDIVTVVSGWPLLKAIPYHLTSAKLIILIGLILLFLPGKRLVHPGILRVIILTVTMTLSYSTWPEDYNFQVTALSVGQGDATLLSMPGEYHFLIDGGGLPGSSIDPGEDLVAPALGRMGIGRLRGVIATHSHPDHSAGLTYILERFQVDTFYYAGDLGDYSPGLRMALEQNDTAIMALNQGWSDIHIDDSCSISLFVPRQNARDINDRSIVTYARQNDAGVLLPADLGKRGLRQLIAAGIPGPVNILKLPHHGSRHAAPESLLEWLKPAYSFASAGHSNAYGFPHQQTIDACVKHQSRLYRTDRDGMLQFKLVAGKWQVSAENRP